MRSRSDRICARRVSAMTSIYPQRVPFGPFEADLETHELWKNGVKLKLGGQPFEILALLLNRPGQMVSREELQKEIWTADTFVDFNHGLNAAVNKLREALSDSAENPCYIETLPRRGYRFIASIECLSPSVARPVPNFLVELSTATAPSPPEFSGLGLNQETEADGWRASLTPDHPWLRYSVRGGLVLAVVLAG